jgi:hypothetical protein
MMQTYMGDLVIHDVHHPAKIQKKLLKILREEGVITNAYPANQDKQGTKVDEDEDEE